MAHIFPSKEDLDDIPYSERIVYDQLSKLPDVFYIFHSVRWNKQSSRFSSTWKENDFLILHKKLGGLVLEVKGGDIEYKNGVFFQINSKTKEKTVLDSNKRNDPLSQAIDGTYHYRRLIGSLSSSFPIECVVWFPSCKIGDKINKFPLAYREIDKAILDSESIKKGAQSIFDIFDFYETSDKTNVTDNEFKNIVDLIASDFELITAPDIKKNELDYTFLKLTKEQTSLLDYITEQNCVTIQGVAGTGKTLIAKEAAKRLGEGNRKVLFLCFNRLLFIDLLHRYPYKNVTYYNINSFISKYSNGADACKSELRIKELAKISTEKLDFDDVIIDEAQDFENDEILYFKNYVLTKNGHFMAFYDKNQLLTTSEVPDWITNAECKLILTKNCRNTRQIASTAYNVIDKELNQQVMMVDGKITGIVFAENNPIEKLHGLIKEVTSEENGYTNSDITILSLCKEEKSFLFDINNILGIPISRERNNNTIFFTTSRKFKGLESRVVIVIDVNKDCFEDEKSKMNFYVACSRATHYLSIIVSGDNDEIKDIAKTIDPLLKYRPEACIAMKTKSKKLLL